MEIKNRRCMIEDLNKFDIMANKDDFIEVCEWANGEGFDISITKTVSRKPTALVVG